MIVLRKFKDKDLEGLNKLFECKHINTNSPKINELIYVCISDGKLIGAIKTSENKRIWTLEYIYIIEKWRDQKIGDGLLRVLINKLNRMKVATIYFKNIDEYLLKKGFEVNEDNILELDIESFLKNSCNCGDSREL